MSGDDPLGREDDAEVGTDGARGDLRQFHLREATRPRPGLRTPDLLRAATTIDDDEED